MTASAGELREEIRLEFFARVRRGNAGDAQARDQTPRAPARSGPRRTARARPGKWVDIQAAAGKPRMNGHEGAEFEQTVAPGQLLFRQQLRQQPYLADRRIALWTPIRKNAREQRPARFPKTRRFPGGNCRCLHTKPPAPAASRYFEDLYADGHRPFATAVREESTRPWKQNERQGEQRHDPVR